MTAPERFADSQIPLAPRAPSIHDAQVRETFAFIERTLAQADAKLSDLVTMTVFLTYARNHPRMTAIRREILGKDFPASASISISHLANPNALIEIQAVAVVN